MASHSAGAVSVSMPLEASGQEWFGFAYGEDWQRHAAFFAAEHAKVLVRDNPGLDPARREQQARRVAQVSAWAARAARSLIVDLRVRATGTDQDVTEGNTDRYDHELRPAHTVAIMEYLQDHGVWNQRFGGSRARAGTTTPLRWPRWRNAADGRHAASRAAGTPRTTRLSTGCRSPLPFWAGPGSRSAAASGGIKYTLDVLGPVLPGAERPRRRSVLTARSPTTG